MQKLARVLLCGALLLSPVARAGADEYQDHVARAMELSRGDQHQQALRAWEAAYAIRQAPRLLYEIARSQQRLGMADEALGSYGRFLSAERGEDPPARADAEAQIGRLRVLRDGRATPLPAPPEPAVAMPVDGEVRYVPVRYERRPNRPLMTAGVVLLSLGYAGAFVTGLTLTGISAASTSSPYSGAERQNTVMGTAGGLLIIPVIGPLISSIYYPSAYRSDAAAYWSLPWMMTSAPLQVAGLIMTVIGARDRRSRPILPKLTERIQITPYSAPDGGGLVAVGRF